MSFGVRGQVIGENYRLLRLVGEGGMGIVWLAEDVRTGRRVAVKLLRAELVDNPRTLQRFQQEAVAASRIGNPHIVEVLEHGCTSSNIHYIVMEFLEGYTLHHLLTNRPVLPIGQAVDILCQVLSGLGATHAKQIIHRDLKPANVFLTRRGGRRDFVKLVDFGVSKILAGGAQITRCGALLGTPNYMAPEQVLATRNVDHRVDLWAAGVILYTALTGRRPFEAPTRNELLNRILSADVKPIRPQRPEVDEVLEQAVLRALERDADRRWPTAEAFRQALLPYCPQGSGIPAFRRSAARLPLAPPALGHVGTPVSNPSTGTLEDDTASTRPFVFLANLSQGHLEPRAPSGNAPAAIARPESVLDAGGRAHAAPAVATSSPPRPLSPRTAPVPRVPVEPPLDRQGASAEPESLAWSAADTEQVSFVRGFSTAGRSVDAPHEGGATGGWRNSGWRWIVAAAILGLSLLATASILICTAPR